MCRPWFAPILPTSACQSEHDDYLHLTGRKIIGIVHLDTDHLQASRLANPAETGAHPQRLRGVFSGADGAERGELAAGPTTGRDPVRDGTFSLISCLLGNPSVGLPARPAGLFTRPIFFPSY